MSRRTFRNGLSRYFPPQLRERARSLPVPSGMMPMAGRGLGRSRASITDRIQPTVPSPPHAGSEEGSTNHNTNTITHN